MERKIKLFFYLDPETVLFLKQYQAQHNLQNRSHALNHALHDLQHRDDIAVTDVLADRLAEETVRQLRAQLDKILAGVNHGDRAAQVNMQLLNALLFYSEYNSLPTGDTPQLAAAKADVKKQIVASRTAKLDRNVGADYE